MLTRSALVRQCAWLLLACTAPAAPAGAQKAPRTPVDSVRPLLDRALRHGSAEGMLTGPATAVIARHFGTSAPIELTVVAEGPVDAAGCRPLAVTTAQDGVVDFNAAGKASAPQRQSFTWRATYCGGGKFEDDVAAPAGAPGGRR